MSELPIFVINKHAISAGDMSGNLDSGAIDIAEIKGFTVQESWTGAPVGNIVISRSSDGINFYALDTQVAGGAPGNHSYDKDVAHYRYIKIAYTFTSGTGSLDVYISGKR